MEIKKRECRVCEKKIGVVRNQIATVKGKSGDGKRTDFTDSSEGIFFSTNKNNGVWFCNSCWKKITEKVKWR